MFYRLWWFVLNICIVRVIGNMISDIVVLSWFDEIKKFGISEMNRIVVVKCLDCISVCLEDNSGVLLELVINDIINYFYRKV